MRIHTDTLTHADILDFTRAHGMTTVYATVSQHGSRTRARAFEVKLSGTSGRRQNSGSYGPRTDEQAATWDEWGMFLDALFDADPAAIVGTVKSPTYAGREHFHAVTTDRYKTLDAASQHPSHTWDWDHGMATCRKCEAVVDRDVAALDYYMRGLGL